MSLKNTARKTSRGGGGKHPRCRLGLKSLLKDDEVSCEVRPPKSPIRSLTLID